MTKSSTTEARGSRQRHANAAAAHRPVPDRDCPLCPRLAAFRHANQAREPLWFNGPVASFGSRDASLLIVGLAPGMQGANRTGRPFTGDYAGDLLYETLLEFGFAKGVYDQRPDDGLTLVNARITNAVRCVPPQNKPLPAEINTCRTFFIATLDDMPNVRAMVLMLGRIAHDTTLKTLGIRAVNRAICAWCYSRCRHASSSTTATIARVTTRTPAC